MNSTTPTPLTARPEAEPSASTAAGSATPTDVAGARRVLHHTYSLAVMTLRFSTAG